jgi:hypothetical protein
MEVCVQKPDIPLDQNPVLDNQQGDYYHPGHEDEAGCIGMDKAVSHGAWIAHIVAPVL